MTLRNNILFAVLLMFFFHSGCRKSDFRVEETESIRDNGVGTGTVTWTKDKDYLLEGLIFVNDGQTLTIEEGTIIRAKTGQGSAATALIVARGGKIIAEGTSAEPIIFTCEGDDLEGSIPLEAKGLWGGVIILGAARLNNQYNEDHIEGIPFSESRGTFGGEFDSDDSGIFRYVSIRHGGTQLREGNEINGLTLGGVGNTTIIDHVEVISNADDGFEFFGGTVNCKYLIASFCNDDAFDYDQGYQGKGQFWTGIQEQHEGSLLIEANGGLAPENGRPLSRPQLFNMTLVGTGTSNDRAGIQFSRNAGGVIANCILVNQERGVEIEFKPGVEDSYKQFETGFLQLNNNIFYEVATSNSIIFKVFSKLPDEDLSVQDSIINAYFTEAGNKIDNPLIHYKGGTYDLVPEEYIFSGLSPYPDDWFDKVTYQGAFSNTYNWASGWTLISQAGILED